MKRPFVFLALLLAAPIAAADPGHPPAAKAVQPSGPAAAPSPGAAEPLRWQRFVFQAEPVYQPLLSGPPQTGGMRSGRVVLAPGKDMERHSTRDNEEMLVFLKGRVRVTLGTEAVEMAEGQALYIPPRTEHSVHNDGPGDAHYVYVVAPAGR